MGRHPEPEASGAASAAFMGDRSGIGNYEPECRVRCKKTGLTIAVLQLSAHKLLQRPASYAGFLKSVRVFLRYFPPHVGLGPVFGLQTGIGPPSAASATYVAARPSIRTTSLIAVFMGSLLVNSKLLKMQELAWPRIIHTSVVRTRVLFSAA